MRIFLVLLGVFCVGIEMCAARKGRQHPPSECPPMPVLSCTGFPGSAEWNTCFSKWDADVVAWSKQLDAYAQQQSHSAEVDLQKIQVMRSPGDTNDGATSYLYINGWIIRAKGCSLTTTNMNGQLKLSVRMPTADEVKAELVANSTNTKQWSVYEGDQLQSWIKITPPKGVSVEHLEHTFANNVLTISGTADAGSGGGSSYSFSSSSGGWSSFLSELKSLFKKKK